MARETNQSCPRGLKLSTLCLKSTTAKCPPRSWKARRIKAALFSLPFKTQCTSHAQAAAVKLRLHIRLCEPLLGSALVCSVQQVRNVQKTHTGSSRTHRQMSTLMLQYSLSPSLICTPPWAFFFFFFSQARRDEAVLALCGLYLFPFIYSSGCGGCIKSSGLTEACGGSSGPNVPMLML